MRNSEPTGTFILVPLADGTFSYGRVVKDPYIAFYDLQTPTPLSDLDAIAAAPVLFTVAVNSSGRGGWSAIGAAPLEGEVARPPRYFIQDPFDLHDCTIFEVGGTSWPASPEECVGLEAASAWAARNVQNRLRDHFEGRLNAEEAFGRVELP